MLYLDIAKALFWDAGIGHLTEARTRLLFWYHCFDQYNGQPIWPVSSLISVVTSSDASSLAWGGYDVNLNGICAKGNFSENEMGKVPLGEISKPLLMCHVHILIS